MISENTGLFSRLQSRWEDWSLFRQFFIAAVSALLAAVLGIGWWVSNRMAHGVIDNSAHSAALYLENSVSSIVQNMTDGSLPEASLLQLDELVERASTKSRVAALKIWRPDGTIIYGKDRTKIGKKYSPSEAFKLALAGKVGIESGGDDDEDDAAESISPAIEIYAPIRKDDAILAVSEIYLPVASIATELRNANVLNWLLLGSWVVLTMSVLFDIVHDGSETIEKQKSRLTGQIRDLTTLLDQNEGLRRQLQDKTAEAALIHERVLQKVSADLHDGPAQLLTFQLLRLNKLAPTIESTMGATGLDELRRLRAAIADTLTEVRAISSGLALPGLMETSLVETLELAITQHFEQTSTSVIFECDDAARQCPPLSLPMKTCLYRLVQEALNNAFRHGGGIGQKVEVTMGVELRVAISNTGPGIGQEPAKTGLGILGMRSRVEALGGVFEIISHGDAGTEVIARFDINEHLDGV